MAYDGKDLEIMVTGPVHDDYGWLLDRLITVVARATVCVPGMGKTTWIRPEIERGLEADQCYMFDPAKLAAVGELLARKVNDIAGYPNPDLAVEVDISRPQVDRPAIYAASRCPRSGRSTARSSASRSSSAANTSRTRGAAGCRSRRVDATRWLVAENTTDPDAWEERVRAWAEATRQEGAEELSPDRHCPADRRGAVAAANHRGE